MSGALLDLYPNRGLRFVRGEGAYLHTADGRRYLDLMTNYGVNIFGYGHPELTSALTRQLTALPTLHGSFGSDVRLRASAALARRLAMPSPRVSWWNSGTEAVEAALKFAVLSTGRKHFVACRNGYHGKTLGALSATGAEKYKEAFRPLLWQFDHVEYGSVDAIAAAFRDDTAAIIVEPIQGEGGIVVPPTGYLSGLRRLADEAGVLLILDEVQTGCGRTGRFLAAQHEGVAPDIVCLGKGLAGGIPVGATIVNASVADRVPRGSHTSTLGGNPLACAGVLSVLDLLSEGVLATIRSRGEFFVNRLRASASASSGEVRGMGLMVGVTAGERRDPLLKALQTRGVLAIPAGSDVVRFLPPFIVTEAELEHACAALADCNRSEAGSVAL